MRPTPACGSTRKALRTGNLLDETMLGRTGTPATSTSCSIRYTRLRLPALPWEKPRRTHTGSIDGSVLERGWLSLGRNCASRNASRPWRGTVAADSNYGSGNLRSRREGARARCNATSASEQAIRCSRPIRERSCDPAERIVHAGCWRVCRMHAQGLTCPSLAFGRVDGCAVHQARPSPCRFSALRRTCSAPPVSGREFGDHAGLGWIAGRSG
jgi:hypothetical protein